MAHTMKQLGSNRGPSVAKNDALSPNGFDNLQDFDDLPSVVSNDLISNADDAYSEASYARNKN